MVRSSKVHGKKLKDGDNLEGKDWISNLSDDILFHILSFMPTRIAARTAILSTRWKSLWTSVPIIDIDYYWGRVSIKEDGLGYREDGPGGLMDFVDRALLLHNSPNLNRFQLHCRTVNPYRLNTWISTVVKRHAQEIVLSVAEGEPTVVKLPSHLFTSLDLVVLKLSFYRFHWFPLKVCLPRLKVLHIFLVKFRDEGFFKNLLSGCPVLEELKIDILAREINTLHICSSTLKKLTVYYGYRGRNAQRGIVIKAPSLETLKLHDTSSSIFEVEELPALVKVDYRVWFHSNEVPTEGYCNAVVQILAKASNVQQLCLSESTLKVVTRASAYNQLLFHSLTHLDISIYDIPWSVVPDLLSHIPSLIVLIMKKDRKCCDVCLWSGAPENVPACLSLSLEEIEFHGFSGCNMEMKLAKYLLENAMVLKKLTLHSWSRNKKIKTDLRKYKKRGSRTCQIKLCHELTATKWHF